MWFELGLSEQVKLDFVIPLTIISQKHTFSEYSLEHCNPFLTKIWSTLRKYFCKILAREEFPHDFQHQGSSMGRHHSENLCMSWLAFILQIRSYAIGKYCCSSSDPVFGKEWNSPIEKSSSWKWITSPYVRCLKILLGWELAPPLNWSYNE